MIEARKVANSIRDTREMAIAYCTDVKEKYFDELRYHVDKLEQLVDDNEWCTSVACPALPGKREGCTEIMHPSSQLHLAMNPVT